MQLHFMIGTVRIMTLATIFLHRGVHLLQVEGIPTVCMALKTDLSICRFSNKEFSRIGRMRIVAGDTIAHTHRSMLVFTGKNGLVVTIKTKRADRLAFFSFKLKPER